MAFSPAMMAGAAAAGVGALYMAFGTQRVAAFEGDGTRPLLLGSSATRLACARPQRRLPPTQPDVTPYILSMHVPGSRLKRRPSWAEKFEGGEGTPAAALLKATATQPHEIAMGEHAAKQMLKRRPSWAAKWEGTEEHERAAASAASFLHVVFEADDETVEAVTHPCMHGL